MNNQGLIYALLQYFTVNEKPRLYRKNTYFEDHFRMSDETAGYFLVIMTCFLLLIAISMMGVL